MSKKSDIYLRVIAGAFVTSKDKSKDESWKMLVKVQVPGGEDLVGLSFHNLAVLDSCMNVLHRIRQEMTKDDKIHPLLRGGQGGDTH